MDYSFGIASKAMLSVAAWLSCPLSQGCIWDSRTLADEKKHITDVDLIYIVDSSMETPAAI